MTDDEKRANQQNLIVAIALIFGSAMLSIFVSPDVGAKAAVIAGVFWLVVSLKWRLKTERWFWAAISIFLILHVIGAVLVPLPLPKGPGISFAVPFLVIDGGAMFLVLSLLERYLRGSGER